MTEDQDTLDVRRVLDGDVDAFEGIVHRWQVRLVTLAYRFCRNRTTAEDMAQAAFLKAFRSLGQWRGDAAFSSWLFALATNAFRSAMRRRNLPVEQLDSALIEAGVVTTGPDPATLERDRRVRHAVATLPPRYRDVLVLFYFHQMDVRATANSLGLPTGTVKARLSRGRDLLRAGLGPFLQPDDDAPRDQRP